jgi:hypothetical protein
MDAGNGCESTLRELAHCGACGAACAPANAVASCATQTCEIVACEGTSADCNGASSDGCETNVATSLASCGRCGNACPADPSNAVARCVEGRCRLTCDPGFADCNRVLDDGCEASLGSAATCGSCGIRCDGTSPSCTGSAEDGYTCAASCGAGASVLCSGSCVDPSDDPLHCGACGAACPERPRSSRQCVSSECEYRCDPGWEDCNDDVARDGCEARLGSVSHCGGCDVRCRLQNATPRCDMGACAIATCESGFADCNGLPSDGCEASAPCS